MSTPLTLACGSYDRTAALADGRARVEGVDLNLLPLSAEETFHRMVHHREFDAAEMSLSTYAILSQDGGGAFVAIPVFLSRAFRHNGVYVRADSGIVRPEDLRGRSVGVPEYQMTAAVWIRGILADRHDVPVASVAYRTGGLHTPGRIEKVAVSPAGIDVAAIDGRSTLTEQLLSGGVDALYSPHPPAPFLDGDPRVRRLWSDTRAVELEYFQATKIFPIMHTVVLRRDVYERNRWLARSLTKAFVEAKHLAMRALPEPGTLPSMLPWTYAEASETAAVMGANFWPYGIEENRAAISTLLRYGHEQGLLRRHMAVDELFAPETGVSFVV